MKLSNKSAEAAAVTSNDPRWAQVLLRDPSADGAFYYSVATTGVYCRPSCRARLPKPEHVRFHLTSAEAEQAGFRPCKRCRPDQPTLKQRHAALIAKVCRFVNAAETPPALDTLAGIAEMSTYHFHRIFKQVTGLTPKRYVAAQQAERVRNELRQHPTVTAAIYDAGYSTQSRFYEKSNRVLGMTPSRFRSGGVDTDIRFAVGECSLGAILVAVSDRGICAIALGDDPEKLVHELQDRFHNAHLVGNDPSFEHLVAQVVGFVETPGLGLDLPLDVRGTAFQQRVWQALQEIPAGSTLSYSELAHRIGVPKAIRAVASACAANILAVAIPCHRVVRSDGSVSGYRWGVDRKRALLLRESVTKNSVTKNKA
ncbi:AraC family transcriptional regulator, regulatory protein of adaptative response / methylated-DNA-[protein]-cysteine methyltransferase [Novimethylophilus kurashikiensis]|uniref:AraC family transcriptional regulator, regulatory protein of adaptative response / methylated-DNA-[protein]-cysteine methyltransferase n=1 Tax=Novimethylophilus kurashikiensis TaxID=1825523 RepID=A0A2R5FB62_9PROT|nr:bifunctional DNA-binding transcriptional regulator/O6-methylguanine-DNA methyltransferase Ada [Novimethylophilus kurashikiensis]GBG15472.1 AraC family transcriptional regulator, regulatory protein of adaptative response / methylated-DNA-[protein]-cysteine methyltransferase [Novimethylophilus kurashikiensis]